MDKPVEIIFSASDCGTRTFWTFVGMATVFVLLGLFAFYFSRLIQKIRYPALISDAIIERLAVYSIIGLALSVIGVMAIGIALGQTNSSLLASGGRIVVRGCVRARSFQSTFDQVLVSATYQVKHFRNSTWHTLILRQKGQRTVEFNLGDDEINKKLALVAPEAMKQYFQDLGETGANTQ